MAMGNGVGKDLPDKKIGRARVKKKPANPAKKKPANRVKKKKPTSRHPK